MTYVVTAGCVDIKDRSCIKECPVDCIYEGERMLYIHPTECIDCGACESVCPQEAIYYSEEIEDPALLPFVEANVDFFAGLGSPRGAAKAPGPHPDVPMVAALPPQES